mmetsp:Transcript_21525/g.85593  ORF Transcript_21525/g.85593 Transcript_21525/m.85593 type:complete len:247 (-) Transcript_21525:115-855(-)
MRDDGERPRRVSRGRRLVRAACVELREDEDLICRHGRIVEPLLRGVRRQRDLGLRAARRRDAVEVGAADVGFGDGELGAQGERVVDDGTLHWQNGAPQVEDAVALLRRVREARLDRQRLQHAVIFVDRRAHVVVHAASVALAFGAAADDGSVACDGDGRVVGETQERAEHGLGLGRVLRCGRRLVVPVCLGHLRRRLQEDEAILVEERRFREPGPRLLAPRVPDTRPTRRRVGEHLERAPDDGGAH